MSTTVSRDNFAVISAVVEMENPDMAKELETQIAEKILENGKSEYSNFSADVTLKETDAENKTADYTVEVKYTDYGEFYEGCPGGNYYDPPDPAELYMDDVDDVLYNMKNCIEKSFDDMGFKAEAEEVDYDIEDLDSILEKMCEAEEMDAYEYYE